MGKSAQYKQTRNLLIVAAIVVAIVVSIALIARFADLSVSGSNKPDAHSLSPPLLDSKSQEGHDSPDVIKLKAEISALKAQLAQSAKLSQVERERLQKELRAASDALMAVASTKLDPQNVRTLSAPACLPSEEAFNIDAVQPEYDFIVPRTRDLASQNLSLSAEYKVVSQRLFLPRGRELSPEAGRIENCGHFKVELVVESKPGLENVLCNPTTGGNTHLHMTMPYRSFWDATWQKRSYTSDFVCTSRTDLHNGNHRFVFEPRFRFSSSSPRVLVAPPKPGLYNMRYEWMSSVTNLPLSRHLVRFPFEVTCELTANADFCAGVKRYIGGRCMSIAQPCGLDLIDCNPADPSCDLSRYSQSTLCNVFPCNATMRRCGIYAAGVTSLAIVDPLITLNKVDPLANLSRCAACTPAACKPNCAQGRKCGSDGCGGTCGQLGGACPIDSKTNLQLECTADGLCIEPVGPTTTPGTCSNPFDLFNMTQNNVATPNPDGFIYNLTVFERYTVPNSTSFAIRPVANQSAWFAANSSDGVTVPETGVAMRITYATSEDRATDQVPVSCSVSGGVPDIIYRFRVTKTTGVEFMTTGIDGDPAVADTVLTIHGGDGTDSVTGPATQCNKIYSADLYPANVLCTDDSVPPAGFGSRVFVASIQPGVYYIVVSAYSAQAVSPYQLWVTFTDTTVYGGASPKCAEKMCGDNEAGFVCNPSVPCTLPNTCVSGKCINCPVTEYVPDCAQRQCGAPADGCTDDHLCGDCKGNGQRICEQDEGRCVVDPVCDPMVPSCSGDFDTGKKADVWCTSDCSWQRGDNLMFDLITNIEREIVTSMYVERRLFNSDSCAFQEGCITGSGSRLLLRQTTNVHNQAMVGFVPGDIARQVRDFMWALCHQHYHFLDFASFNIRAAYDFAVTHLSNLATVNIKNETTVFGGGKLSYCIEDTRRYMHSPRMACEASSSCSDQGLLAGWTDEYNANLDCQWTDNTNQETESINLAKEIALGCIVAVTNTSFDCVMPMPMKRHGEGSGGPVGSSDPSLTVGCIFNNTILPGGGVHNHLTPPGACMAPIGYLNRWYWNEVDANVARRIPEYSYKNNKFRHLVFVPYVPSIVGRASYYDFFNMYSALYRDPCSQLPAGGRTVFCDDIFVVHSPAYNVSKGLAFTW